jgi:hypothetical protein
MNEMCLRKSYAAYDDRAFAGFSLRIELFFCEDWIFPFWILLEEEGKQPDLTLIEEVWPGGSREQFRFEEGMPALDQQGEHQGCESSSIKRTLSGRAPTDVMAAYALVNGEGHVMRWYQIDGNGELRLVSECPELLK